MKKQLTKKQLIAQIKKHADAIAQHRDELREVLGAAEDIVQDSDEGVRELEDAIEILSRNL